MAYTDEEEVEEFTIELDNPLVPAAATYFAQRVGWVQ